MQKIHKQNSKKLRIDYSSGKSLFGLFLSTLLNSGESILLRRRRRLLQRQRNTPTAYNSKCVLYATLRGNLTALSALFSEGHSHFIISEADLRFIVYEEYNNSGQTLKSLHERGQTPDATAPLVLHYK